jgi:hypothetical protein
MLLDTGDMLPDWIKANQGLAAAASGLTESARGLVEAMADNGQVCFMWHASLSP